MSEIEPRRNARRTVFFTLLLLSSILLALVAVLQPMLSNTLSPAPQVGEVALRDYRAPRTITYVSEVQTEQRRDTAERSVAPVFTLPDTRVARQQLEALRATLTYITNVRADTYATANQKLDDMAALEDIYLSQEIALSILEMTDARWQAVQQEALAVLEKTMSSAIRPEGVEDARNRLPALVSLSLPEEQAGVVAELASAFVAANSQYSQDLTLAAQQKARQEVTPVNRMLVAGQTILLRGQVFGATDIEALQQLGLVQPQEIWPELVSAAALVLLLAAFLLFFFRRERLGARREARSVALIAILFLAFLFSARMVIPGRTIIPYAFPLAAYGLTIAALFGAKLALISSLPLAILVAYGLPYSQELMLFYMMSSLFGIFALGRARRIASFFYAGVAIALSSSVIVFIYRLPLPTTDAIGLATLIGAAFFNGVASTSVTILFHFILAQFLGMTTPMQLVELTRPDHPVLKLLLRDAPGTYQHSLQIANLAEQAAERIGADTLLTRVGSLYHDVGKSLNPLFFIENQMPGFVNPHDGMNPFDSAEIIIRHVQDGLELGRRYRLPRSILDFIAEHHGTMIARYQYVKAVEAASGDESQVDMERFRYPGPRPRSRETAILMLADGCEARVRAEHPADEAELRDLIKELINNRVSRGQLDDTNLTLSDLNVIVESFVTTLRGIYHPRVKYPKMETTLAEDEEPLAIEKSRPQLEAPAPADGVLQK